MAVMKDNMPSDFEGEKKVWQCIKDNLPDDIICYYNREVKGREFDYCLLIKDIGFLLIEVKGWSASHIKKVEAPDRIIMTDGSVNSSPKKQVKSYSFCLKNIMNEKHNINPLILNMVCYPFISEYDYKRLGLDIVSEPEYTLFSDDIMSSHTFTGKILCVYNNFRFLSFDKMTDSTYDKARHHFEPSYVIKPPMQKVTPYSCLTVLSKPLSLSMADEIIKSYFEGTKQIIFTSDYSDIKLLASQISDVLTQKHIEVNETNLSIKSSDEGMTNVEIKENHILLFNFEAVYSEKYKIEESFKTFNGVLTEEQKYILEKLAEATQFNINQFYIEHAEIGRDIYIRAGAGTGKTYSMVSRIAFLCSEASNSEVYDPASEIAMLTFTSDAALNMKKRLKKLFMNYFILTGNTKYLELTANMESMRISTIHSFTKEVIQNTSAVIGVGTDFTTVSGTYDKQRIFDRLFTKFLENENKNNPLFFDGFPIQIDQFRKYLLEFAKKLYEKGCDIKNVSIKSFGTPPEELPYINKIFEEVVIEAEREYSKLLVNNNAVNLEEYMIHLKNCVDDEAFNTNLYEFKYLFIDEFQDTDDAQIASFVDMQKKLGFNFFIVGDLKQSIYRFRGATMDAFNKMGCSKDKWLFYTLNINYRSDKRLLDKYAGFFSKLGRQKLLPYDENKGDRLTGVKNNGISDELLVQRQPYENAVKTKSCEYYNKLFEVVENEKARIEAEMTRKRLSSAEMTIALLLRKNYQINDVLKEAKSRGIEIESDNNTDLYRLPPAIDLCKLTSALCNPYNPTYLYALISSNNVNADFNLTAIYGKTKEEKTEIFIDCLDKFYKAAMGKTLNKLIKAVQNEPVLKTLRLIYEAAMPWKVYSEDKNKQEFYRLNYEAVFEELSYMNRKSYITLASVNESLHVSIMTGTEAKSREINKDTDGVRIICQTVHKSKGLEYGTVILPATDDKIDLLHRKGIDAVYIDGNIGYCFSDRGNQICNEFYQISTETREMEMEEVRILYVAMTRAMNNFIWFDRGDSKDHTWGELLREM